MKEEEEQRRPICRGAWEFKQGSVAGEPPPLRDQS